MISSSSTFVDVHTDARRSTSSRSSSSRRASFVRRAVRRPRLPACTHSRIHHNPGRSPRGPERGVRWTKKRLYWGRIVPICASTSLCFIRTHPYPILYQCVSHRSTKKTKHSRRAHRPDPTTRAMDGWMDGCRRRPRERDARTTRRVGRRTTRRRGDRPCREGYRTGCSPCSRCERRRDETRRTSDG